MDFSAAPLDNKVNLKLSAVTVVSLSITVNLRLSQFQDRSDGSVGKLIIIF